jgi:hypothetical protein
MQLGETIATYDVALALRGESGKFDVTSPTGEVYHVTCEPNHSIANLEWAGNRTDPQPFLIRKISEPVSPDGKILSTGADAANMRAPMSPFLLDQAGADKAGARAVVDSLKSTPATVSTPEVVGLDLVFTESDAATKNPSACVALRAGHSVQSAQLWITAACSNYNDFDVEIRRLQAQLDEIRYRARKRFYKTQAATVVA